MRFWHTFRALAGATLLFATCTITSASAMELWDPHLRAGDEGMASGAALPKGVYGVMDNYWGAYSQFDNNGHKNGTKLDVLVEVPILMWQTGYKVLGADLSMAIAQPFDYTNLRGAGVDPENAHWGTFNTMIIPVQLSWALPEDFHVATNLTVYADDATSSPADPPYGNGIGSGNGYWTLEPNLGVSWLHNGWNASVSFHYDYNFKDSHTNYKSGQQIAVDYTLTKTFGKWTLGVGAHHENQITDDSGAGAAGCVDGCRVFNSGIGPIIGYNFGNMQLNLVYNQNIHTENDVAGSIINLRLVSRL